MQKHSTAHGAVSVSVSDAARDARHHCDQYGDARSYALTQSAADVHLYIHADNPDDLNALAGRLNELAHTWRIALGTVPSPLPPPTTSSVTDDAPAHGIERPNLATTGHDR